jgi:hypothetical protein
MSLSTLEEDLDHLLQLGEGEPTACRGAHFFNYFSDSNNDATTLLGSHQGPMMTPTTSGQLGHRKGTKSSKFLDLNLLRSATDIEELSF